MKIYLASWLMEKSQGDSLTKKKSKTRLLSFHFLKQQKIKPVDLSTYHSTGRFDPKTNQL